MRLFLEMKAALVGDPPPRVRVRLRMRTERRLRRWLGRRYEGVEVVRFVGKVRNGFGHWFTFVTVPGVEPTNNRAERALKEMWCNGRSLVHSGTVRAPGSTRR
jgi:anti-sigma factor RsiW